MQEKVWSKQLDTGVWISAERIEDINVEVTGIQMAFQLGENHGSENK